MQYTVIIIYIILAIELYRGLAAPKVLSDYAKILFYRRIGIANIVIANIEFFLTLFILYNHIPKAAFIIGIVGCIITLTFGLFSILMLLLVRANTEDDE